MNYLKMNYYCRLIIPLIPFFMLLGCEDNSAELKGLQRDVQSKIEAIEKLEKELENTKRMLEGRDEKVSDLIREVEKLKAQPTAAIPPPVDPIVAKEEDKPIPKKYPPNPLDGSASLGGVTGQVVDRIREDMGGRMVQYGPYDENDYLIIRANIRAKGEMNPYDEFRLINEAGDSVHLGGFAMDVSTHLRGYYDFYKSTSILLMGPEERIVHLSFRIPKENKSEFTFQYKGERQTVQIIDKLDFQSGSLESRNPDVRSAAAWALAGAASIDSGKRKAIVSLLSEALENDEDAEVRKAISDALERIDS